MFQRNRRFLALVAALLFSWASAGWVHADLQAFVGRDVVELTDGTRIECLVLIESSRGVLIVLPNLEKGQDAYRQQFIPAERIKKVTRGMRQGETKAFKTDNERAVKIVQGGGVRPAKPAEPVQPTGPIAPATPPASKPAPGPAPAPATTGKGALSAKDLAQAYLNRFQALEDATEQLLGDRSQLAPALEAALADPAARLEAERLLNLFLQPVRTQAPPTTTPDKPKAVKPAPHPAKPAPNTQK